jgi:hypothetical protein
MTSSTSTTSTSMTTTMQNLDDDPLRGLDL